jgi:YidC/Oxa1 family membrane protein insertase
MEGGRLLLAIVLMIAVVIVTNIIFPPAPPPDRPAVPADTAAPPVPPVVDAVPAVPPAAVPPGAPEAFVERIVVAASPLYRFGLSTRGAALVRAELLEFESHTRLGSPVDLVPDAAAGLIRYRLRVGEATLDLSGLEFTPDPAEGLALAPDGGPAALRMVHQDTVTGFGIELRFTFRPDDYLVHVAALVRGTGGTTPQLLIDMGPRLPFHEWNEAEDTRALAYVVNGQQTGINSVPLGRLRNGRTEEGPLTWVALKNKYFVVAVIQDDRAPMPFGGLIARPTGVPHEADLTATLLPNPEGEIAFRAYFGPQQYERLAEVGHRLTEVNPIGWRFLRPVIQPLAHGITWLLLEMHRVLGVGYGWVLVLFGVLVRVVLWPLNARAMRSQLKNMEFQPRIKEIQTKYKADPEKMQKEMLRLYKEEGFNPMGGCLPMLIPLPVLITLFFVFQATIEFRGESFLWLPDLSRADPLYILPVALGASMFMLQWFSMRATPDVQPQMKMMMYIMPPFMTIIFLNFASGLNLYYTAMNIASVPQQILINRERRRWHATRGAPKKPAEKAGRT